MRQTLNYDEIDLAITIRLMMKEGYQKNIKDQQIPENPLSRKLYYQEAIKRWIAQPNLDDPKTFTLTLFLMNHEFKSASMDLELQDLLGNHDI